MSKTEKRMKGPKEIRDEVLRLIDSELAGLPEVIYHKVRIEILEPILECSYARAEGEYQ